MIIGLSTASLYKWNLDIYQKIEIVLNSNFNGIEIALRTKDELLNFKPPKIKTDKRISIHLPWRSKYTENSLNVFEKMREIENSMKVDCFVVHCDDVEDFKIFENSNVIFENLWEENKFGHNFEQIKEVAKKTTNGFVLDISHMFKGGEIKRIDDYIKMLKGRIKELHVSGIKDDYEHTQLFKSDNKMEVLGILKKFKNIPIVLEGVVEKRENLENDINFINRHLGSVENQ